MIKNILVGFFISVLITWLLIKKVTIMSHADILTISGVISTVAGILFGFVLAAISIFSSSSGNENGLIHALKQNKILPKLIKDLLSTGVLLIIACILPLLAMFTPDTSLLANTRGDFLLIMSGFSFLITSILFFTLVWRKINWILPHI